MERTTSSALIRFALVPNARTQGDRLHECNHNQKQNKCLVDIYGRTKFIYPIDFNCRIHWRALTLTYTSKQLRRRWAFLMRAAGSMQAADTTMSERHTFNLHTQNWFWCFLGLLTCYILNGIRNLPLRRMNDTVNHMESRRKYTHAAAARRWHY